MTNRKKRKLVKLMQNPERNKQQLSAYRYYYTKPTSWANLSRYVFSIEDLICRYNSIY